MIELQKSRDRFYVEYTGGRSGRYHVHDRSRIINGIVLDNGPEACFVDGEITINGRRLYAHRLAYELFVGQIPIGKEIDHLCRNRLCCNPKHLEPVSRKENLSRSPIMIWGKRSAKTHCNKGHPLSGDNIRIQKNNHRVCRICENDRCRRYIERKRSAAC